MIGQGVGGVRRLGFALLMVALTASALQIRTSINLAFAKPELFRYVVLVSPAASGHGSVLRECVEES
jgi:hypothetical protein